jgi:hypothetical protein
VKTTALLERVARTGIRSLVVAATLFGVASPGAAETTAMSRQQHPWGRFEAGAWKRYRTQTETLAENGNVAETLTTETRITLEKIDADGVTLRMEGLVELGGKQLSADPKTIKQGFHGETDSDKLTISKQGQEDVFVDGGRRVVACRVERIEKSDPGGKTIIRVFFSDRVPPYVMKRETTQTDAAGSKVLQRTVMSVQSLNAPCRVLNIRWASHLVAETKHARGATKTFAFVSQHVPGGVVCQTTEDYDEQGRRLRTATLQLIDYGLEPEKGREPLLERWRKRSSRSSRGSTPYTERRPK